MCRSQNPSRGVVGETNHLRCGEDNPKSFALLLNFFTCDLKRRSHTSQILISQIFTIFKISFIPAGEIQLAC